jgi:hypothetical protein
MVYKLTRQGRAVLKRHLVAAVTRDDVVWRMDDLMLRFAMMDEIVGRAATLRFLGGLAAEIEAYIRELRCYLDGARAGMPICGRLAMESGIESYEMHAVWARRAIEELEADA